MVLERLDTFSPLGNIKGINRITIAKRYVVNIWNKLEIYTEKSALVWWMVGTLYRNYKNLFEENIRQILPLDLLMGINL